MYGVGSMFMAWCPCSSISLVYDVGHKSGRALTNRDHGSPVSRTQATRSRTRQPVPGRTPRTRELRRSARESYPSTLYNLTRQLEV
jgi:hypothetical protein